MITEESIRQRIEKLRGELDRLVAQANQQIAAYQAAIQVLEELISPPGATDEKEKKKDEGASDSHDGSVDRDRD